MKIQNAMLVGLGAFIGAGLTVAYFEYVPGKSAPLANNSLAIGTPTSAEDDAQGDRAIYQSLKNAKSDGEIRAAMDQLNSVRGPCATISPVISNKVFTWVKNNSSGSDFEPCILAGHLAAISGNVELLRETVCSYFGEAEAESKGDYVEEFMQCHPDLFFSLPDAWLLWHGAGGAGWCCNHPDKIVPILARFAPQTRNAMRMLTDVRDTAMSGEYGETEWGKQARTALAQK